MWLLAYLQKNKQKVTIVPCCYLQRIEAIDKRVLPVSLLSCSPKAITGRAEAKNIQKVGANILAIGIIQRRTISQNLTYTHARARTKDNSHFSVCNVYPKINKELPNARTNCGFPIFFIACNSSFDIFFYPFKCFHG